MHKVKCYWYNNRSFYVVTPPTGYRDNYSLSGWIGRNYDTAMRTARDLQTLLDLGATRDELVALIKAVKTAEEKLKTSDKKLVIPGRPKVDLLSIPYDQMTKHQKGVFRVEYPKQYAEYKINKKQNKQEKKKVEVELRPQRPVDLNDNHKELQADQIDYTLQDFERFSVIVQNYIEELRKLGVPTSDLYYEACWFDGFVNYR